MATKDRLKIMQRLLLQIPRGRVTTYKEIGLAMGTKGYRFVGQLLHQNPEPDRYPCFKVVKSDGSLGGFDMGEKEKIRRLRADGIEIKDGKMINFDHILYQFE